MQNIDEIYEEYSSLIYKYLFCLTQDEHISEDLAQETFIIAFNKINSFKGECKLSSWLCQIAKHLWYKQLKKDKRNKTISLNTLDYNISDNTDIEDIICNNEDKEKLLENIENLGSPFKDVVFLKINGNLNFVEIAEILGKTPNWARVTFFRAKQKLKEENKK